MRKLNIKGAVIVTAVAVFIAGHVYTDKMEQKAANEYINNAQQQMTQQQEIYNNHEFPTREKKEEKLTYFDNAKEELKELVKKDNIDKIKSKGKEYITTGIDFIFYDKAINGIYFND